VEPTSLAMLECAKTGDRSAAAWRGVLQKFENLEFVLSDAARGISRGVQDVAAARAHSAGAAPLGHGLDVFHTNLAAGQVLAGPWQRAESAWEEAEEAEAKLVAAKQQGINACKLAQTARRLWNQAVRLLEEAEQPEKAWQRARAVLGIFRPDGTLNDRSWAEAEIQAALTGLSDMSWKKVRNFLTDARTLAFIDRMHLRLAKAEPDKALREACVRRWWLRHHRPTTAASEPPTPQDHVQALLDAVIRDKPLSAVEQAAYERVSAVL
jgi:hypothetical protein